MKSGFLCAIYSTVLFACLMAPVHANSAIKTVNDIREIQQQASSENIPILLLFTSEGCDYCEAIRNNYLNPMIASGDYRKTILFRQLYIDEFNLLRDREGKLVGGDQLALQFSVDVAPTILFIDAKGQEVAERIVGLSGADYFDETLQQHIQQAVKVLAESTSVE